MPTSSRTPPLPHGHLPVVPPGSQQVDMLRFPALADLMARLHFSTSDGRIWLDEQRMLLVHASALGALRKEMIETLGVEVARGFMTRMGYHAGVGDAQMARRVRPAGSVKDMFVVGPQLHCLEGIGLSEAVRLECDVEKGSHYGEFVWTSPVEDEEHSRYFEIGTEPACWMQIGYASGYSTEFMGRPVLYREVECQSMGQPACRIVGKLVAEWGAEAEDDLRYLMPGAIAAGLRPTVGRPASTMVQLEGEAPDAGAAIGISPGFNAAMHMVRKVSPTQATVLFLGESGVGKEVFARTLHRLSSRSQKPFVAVNCAAIPEQLLESELFGVERGAFTGATQSRAGRFERADGGTLFLDEIGTLSLDSQGKLLRVLQEGEVERVGDTSTRDIDVRVIAATNVDLRAESKAGRFREDLFYRLNVFPIRILPLRERREDIPLLMTHFLATFNRRHGRCLTGFTQRAVDAMLTYDWPGNIRELENVIERGVILATDNTAIDSPQLFTSGESFGHQCYELDRKGRLVARDPKAFTAEVESNTEVDRVLRRLDALLHDEDGEGEIGGEGDNVSLDEIETLLLKRAVERANGNVAAAARMLGITRPQMVYRLKNKGIGEHGG